MKKEKYTHTLKNPVLIKIREFMETESEKRAGTIFLCNEANLSIPLANDMVAKFEFGNRNLGGQVPYHKPWVCGFEISGAPLKEYFIETEGPEDVEEWPEGYIPYVDWEGDGTINSIMMDLIIWCSCFEKYLILKP